MACGSCSKRRNSRDVNNARNTSPENYDLASGVDIKSLNDRQIRARLELFKRKFCKDCKIRYTCDYPSYLNCKGLNKK